MLNSLANLATSLWAEKILFRNLLASLLLLLALLLVRSITLRLLRRSRVGERFGPLRLAVYMRWSALFVLVFGLIIIWAAELRTLALSLAAVAAAVAIATKELLMNLAGAAMRASSRSFEIGDRIDIGGVRGDVIDHQPLTTTLMEVGPGHQRTGRAIVFPNGRLLTEPLINETFTDDYVLHTVSLPVAIDSRLTTLQMHLLQIGEEATRAFIEDARRHIDATAAKHGLSSISVSPKVSLHLTEPDRGELRLRVPCPARERSQIEQKIVQAFVLGLIAPREGHA